MFEHGKCIKNGNRTHDMFEKWESNPWICIKMGIEPMNLCKNGNRTHEYVDGVNWNNTTGLKFSSGFMTESVNLNYSIVWVWESNQEPTQVWNLKPIPGVQRDLNPWICCRVDFKQYKCSNLGIEPMNHVLWDKILVKKKIFFFFNFLYLGDGFCPQWGCYYCLLWSCSLFIWAP